MIFLSSPGCGVPGTPPSLRAGYVRMETVSRWSIESSLSKYYARRLRMIEDCLVPLHFPIRNSKTGVETKELLITKGTSVHIGLGAANRSGAIWGPDASKLEPERWLWTRLKRLPKKLNGALVSQSFLTPRVKWANVRRPRCESRPCSYSFCVNGELYIEYTYTDLIIYHQMGLHANRRF